ncbi:MAG: hypothetical protein ACREMZ_05545 [Gemmatimonadales bacterium]
MSANAVTCELVEQRDLDTRYLTGRLSQEDAEAFEAHYFACERCWGLVQQGLEVQAAVTPSPKAPYRRWWGLAAAAGIAAVALGLWGIASRPQGSRPEDVFRGGGTPFLVAAAAGPTALAASWPRLPEADVYRVRLYAADGMMALERETSDTVISVPLDSIARLTRDTAMFWQVHALDRLRISVARSDLTRAVLPEP